MFQTSRRSTEPHGLQPRLCCASQRRFAVPFVNHDASWRTRATYIRFYRTLHDIGSCLMQRGHAFTIILRQQNRLALPQYTVCGWHPRKQ